MRWWIIFLLCLGVWGCENTYVSNTYTYYELVHSPGQLKIGDRIKIVTIDEVTIVGRITRMRDDGLVVTDQTEGNQRLWWKDVHVMHKVKTTVTEKE